MTSRFHYLLYKFKQNKHIKQINYVSRLITALSRYDFANMHGGHHVCNRFTPTVRTKHKGLSIKQHTFLYTSVIWFPSSPFPSFYRKSKLQHVVNTKRCTVTDMSLYCILTLRDYISNPRWNKTKQNKTNTVIIIIKFNSIQFNITFISKSFQ